MKKISAELLDTIKNRIVDAIRPEKIILFGSHAWGIPGDDSDIDLYIVVAKSDQPAYKKAREVYRALRGVNVPLLLQLPASLILKLLALASSVVPLPMVRAVCTWPGRSPAWAM